MKETGLMFKAPLVRAILSGQKTQTRRVMNPQPASCIHDAWPTKWVGEGCEWHCAICGNGNRLNPRVKSCVSGINCPMGKPGDRIYVRETFVQGFKTDPSTGDLLQWGADGEELPMTTWFRATDGGISWSDDDGWETNVPWKPAIHMPKDLARIWLEITGVRVERLQGISPDDCIAEGAWPTDQRELGRGHEAISAFRELWDSTTGRPKLPENKQSKRYARVKHWLDTHPDTTGWAANPWVWVIDFKTISTTGRPA